MEGVIEANKAAVESCHRVLSLISQPKDQLQSKDISFETGEAMCKFKRVISILDNRVGHARIRKSKKPPIPLPQSILLDTPITKADQPSKSLQFLQSSSSDGIRFRDMRFDSKVSLSLGNSSLELSSNEKRHCQTFQQRAVAQYHILQQQQQKVKQEPEMTYHRSNSGVSLTFDGSSCTPTMSSTRSFVSSLSVDGSVADMCGNSFHLFGGPGSSDQSSLQLKKKCSVREDGSVKYGSSSRCHCSKKRKNKVKRSIKVPAISNKLADIPPDDYSWRKYGQKPIKGSPYPRGYYRCSCVKACSARKHVERCLEDPSMLIVTYEGEHTHPKLPLQNALNSKKDCLQDLKTIKIQSNAMM